jgi:hypothetical protein
MIGPCHGERILVAPKDNVQMREWRERWIGFPKKPDLRADVMETLEKRGVDSVRAMLVNHTGPGPGASVPLLMHPDPSRADVEAWLNWKTAIDVCWVRAAVLLGAVSAIAAIAAAILAGLAWRFPTMP